ncbi:hypothetical protein BDF20DRAFT_138269 [Mycotypha africana]|uniref:uncharacterized protein n=1 Tax=Mycotypha africana TaxID=64632 RepID=UPI0022FFDD43|nr:uncharacterized protein BDF20DRAFT_138269 [Mycotypha africana]KAI8968991.1 hypothetical protein BDF20DRAFT_138269 [Mycotypha africana]
MNLCLMLNLKKILSDRLLFVGATFFEKAQSYLIKMFQSVINVNSSNNNHRQLFGSISKKRKFNGKMSMMNSSLVNGRGASNNELIKLCTVNASGIYLPPSPSDRFNCNEFYFTDEKQQHQQNQVQDMNLTKAYYVYYNRRVFIDKENTSKAGNDTDRVHLFHTPSDYL